MIHYPHFAFSNLYLDGGYREIQAPDGNEVEYLNPDALEQCVRRLLLRKPSRLRGWDLRFLRRGLGMTQTQFGKLVDRTEQSVARWEKGKAAIPAYVDLTIRTRFAQRFESTMPLSDLLNCIDGRCPPLPERLVLRFDGQRWVFHIPSLKRTVESRTEANAIVAMPLELRAIYPIRTWLENKTAIGHVQRQLIVRASRDTLEIESISRWPSELQHRIDFGEPQGGSNVH